MIDPAIPSYLLPYHSALERSGDLFTGLLWASPTTQAIRFAALQRMQNMAGRTVLDVGCGRADLLEFLLDQDCAPMHYVGLEAIEEFCRAAEGRNRTNCMIVRGDFLAQPVKMFVGAEIVLFSGSLNTLNDNAFYETLRLAFDATAEVMVFNFLASPELAGKDYLTWHAPQDVMSYCRKLTDDVSLIDDYLRGDCTIRMRKPTA